MPITIENATASTHVIPDGATVTLNVSFTGHASSDNTEAIVRFELSPSPELNFSGRAFVNAPFMFNKAPATFRRTLNITNQSPTSVNDRFGLIVLIAKEISTGIESPATISIRFR